MAYLPLKARSEWVTPMNGSAGGMFESSRMFQAVSAALVTMIFLVVSFDHLAIVPAASPTRGSGLGAEGDMFCIGDGPAPADGEEDEEHDTPASSTIASGTARTGR